MVTGYFFRRMTKIAIGTATADTTKNATITNTHHGSPHRPHLPMTFHANHQPDVRFMRILTAAIMDDKERAMNDNSITNDPELDLPMASGLAFRAAGLEAKAKCAPIVESVDGQLCEVLSDGTRRVIGHIKPTTAYPPDTKIDLL